MRALRRNSIELLKVLHNIQFSYTVGDRRITFFLVDNQVLYASLDMRRDGSLKFGLPVPKGARARSIAQYFERGIRFQPIESEELEDLDDDGIPALSDEPRK